MTLEKKQQVIFDSLINMLAWGGKESHRTALEKLKVTLNKASVPDTASQLRGCR